MHNKKNKTKKRGEFHLAFAMRIIGVIIPHSSIRLTIPVAFRIYNNLLALQISELVSVKQGDLYCTGLLFYLNQKTAFNILKC